MNEHNSNTPDTQRIAQAEKSPDGNGVFELKQRAAFLFRDFEKTSDLVSNELYDRWVVIPTE
jgi:hypothetical protein